jgi:hypothetical protein
MIWQGSGETTREGTASSARRIITTFARSLMHVDYRQRFDRLPTPAEAFLDERVLVAGRPAGRVISFNMTFCCRCISAVQKPRAAPAQVFAALSQRLRKGFFDIARSLRG